MKRSLGRAHGRHATEGIAGSSATGDDPQWAYFFLRLSPPKRLLN